jgi:hypothetical protein
MFEISVYFSNFKFYLPVFVRWDHFVKWEEWTWIRALCKKCLGFSIIVLEMFSYFKFVCLATLVDRCCFRYMHYTILITG